MKKDKSELGFTLVELLVVIIIIGILAAVAVPAFLNQRQRANDSAVQQTVKSYVDSANSYLIENPNVGEYFGADPGASISDGSANARVLLEIEGARKNADVTIIIYGDPSSDAGYQICGWHFNGKAYKGLSASHIGVGTDKGFYRYNSGTGTFSNPRGASSVSGPVC